MLPVDVVKKTLEALESGDLGTTNIYLSSDFICKGLTPDPLDKAQYLNLMDALLVAIPNWTFNSRNIIEKGNIVRINVRITGKNAGVLNVRHMGIGPIPPKGMKIVLPEERIEYAVKDNKILSMKVESGARGGIYGILEQLKIQIPEAVNV